MAFNLSSLATRLLMLLVAVLAVSLAVVYWIIDSRAKPEVTSLASQTVVATGNEAVNGMIARLNQIDSIAMTASHMVTAMPKDTSSIYQSFGNLISHTDKRIVGGGVWYDPDKYKAGVEQQAFVWKRDKQGSMQPDSQFASLNPTMAQTLTQTSSDKQQLLATPYYRDWWYVPAMYAEHDHCVWSRAYIQASSGVPIVTCAKALFDAKTNVFEGVVSLDIMLNRLQSATNEWQQKTGGYVFLVDMNNNFLTYPDESLVKKVTADNPQGEMINVDTFAINHPSFAPIAQSLNKANERLINKAKKIDAQRFEFKSNTIVSSTNLQRTTLKEAEILTALLFTNGIASNDVNSQQHFIEQVSLNDDNQLKAPSTAFIFGIPMNNWKLVIVKPNHELTAFADKLGQQLQWWLLLGFIPVLLLSAMVFRQVVAAPLRRMATNVNRMSKLIEEKRYLNLEEHKLPPTKVSEIAVISDAMNHMIDRVVENEGALAQVNERLEQQVVERTGHLNQALKELKASQVQLVQAEKMSTLGQMVAGVAHEVNTPLGYVRSNLELIEGNLGRYNELVANTQQLKQLMTDKTRDEILVEDALQQTLACSDEIVADELRDDLHGLISDAQFGVGQISELVVSLRDFSRLDQAKIKQVNVNDCIKSSLLMARSNIKYLQVIEKLGEIAEVSCNPSQINQVLLNLFNNAAQAMPDGHDGKLQVESFEDSQNVYIRVSDNGSGIAADVIKDIFEPFFTTKPVGEGTGLGLAISAQIMAQHGGDINVESAVGKGTRFTLRLPKTQNVGQTKPKLAIADD